MLLIAQGQVQTPKTASELGGMIARRDELRSQLQAVTEQRESVANQLERTGSDPAIRNPLLERLRSADDRIGQLERETQQLDNAIAKAKAEGVSSEGQTTIYVPTPPPAIPDFPALPPSDAFAQVPPPWRERVIDSLEVTAPITIATVVLLGALLYWRISRSMRNQFTRMLAMQQSQLEEIQRSVDTVAVEMERVSENQRFVTKLVGDKAADKVRV